MRDVIAFRVRKYGGGWTNVSLSRDIFELLVKTFEGNEKKARRFLSDTAETIESKINLSQRVRGVVARRLFNYRKPDTGIENPPATQKATPEFLLVGGA